MSLRYSFGRVESRTDIITSAQFAADNAGFYPDDSHREWAFGKLLPRLESGQAGASMVRYEGIVIALGIVYATTDPTGSAFVEQKFLRTLDHFADHGLGRLTMRQSIVVAAEMLDVEPGTPLQYHLDTRANNHTARQFFEGVGCVQTDISSLYTPDAIDVSYALTTHAPRTPFMT